MDATLLKPIIESMIFVSEEPLTEGAIIAAFDEQGIDKEQVRQCLEAIDNEWNSAQDRGVGLVKVAGGYQFRTKSFCADWLKKLSIPKPMRLSGPALETMAIVAYRQPILRSEVEKIRGVDSGGVLKTLLERRLLRIVGRSSEPGQPLLYGTTQEFLQVFNLNNLKELPTLRDIDDLMRERRFQAQGMTEGGETILANGDDEELTEVIDEEDEEETEIIRRRPLDEDEEEEKKDMEALDELEGNLKHLRRLEKDIFPKPTPEIEALLKEGETSAISENGSTPTTDGQETSQEVSPGEIAEINSAAGEDPASAADRAFD